MTVSNQTQAFHETESESITCEKITTIDLHRPPTLAVTTQFIYDDEMIAAFTHNQLNPFLNTLFDENKAMSKVVTVDDTLFVSLKDPLTHFDSSCYWLVSPSFLWALTPSKAFSWKNIARKSNKKHWLATHFFTQLSAVVDEYAAVYQHQSPQDWLTQTELVPNRENMRIAETTKRELFHLRRAVTGLRDVITKLGKAAHPTVKHQYMSELSEQVEHLLADIDFDLQALDSQIGYMQNRQDNQMNEIMKVLTIISVIFLPLNLIAGIFGMNFVNIPELKWHYGFYLSLLGMLLSAGIIAVYLKWKKWF